MTDRNGWWQWHTRAWIDRGTVHITDSIGLCWYLVFVAAAVLMLIVTWTLAGGDDD